MKTRLLLVLALVLSASACNSQPALVPNSVLIPMSAQAYEEETAKFPIITSGAQYDMVQRIGARIAAASALEADWEFRLLDAPDVVNAFAMPGGKVAVYTGILAVTQNEDALAAVMGHEVAHVTEEHGNKRMTQAIGQQALLIGADVFLDWKGMGDDTKGLVLGSLGVGSELGVKAFSRGHESEADEIGLRFLVRSGYDPNEAPLLWERMAQLSGGSSDPFQQLLATHPEPLERAARLRELIPEIVAQEGPARP